MLPVGETKEEPAEAQGTRFLLVLGESGHSAALRMLISSADSARVKPACGHGQSTASLARHFLASLSNWTSKRQRR